MVILNGVKEDIFYSQHTPMTTILHVFMQVGLLLITVQMLVLVEQHYLEVGGVGSCGVALYILNSSHNHRLDFFGAVKSKDKQEMME